jgi:glycosyltransferase involved in cell wall biosynthesis
MRILVAHNAYQLRGGEDEVVDAEVDLLRRHGHEVRTLLRHNDELRTMPPAAAALQTFGSARTRRDVQTELERFRPAVVHVHNWFPLLSPSLHRTCARAGVPLVQTLHNFRLACPQATFLRDGRVCEDCLGRAPWPAVRHGCYRGSAAQTAVLAGMLMLHRTLGTWHQVSVFVALNEFCRRKFVQAGLPAERIAVKPNFVEAPEPAGGQRQGFLFVGRLAEEKGLGVLAAACARMEGTARLRIVGEGPAASALDGLRQVERLGRLPAAQVQQCMAQARALVLPSTCIESHPRTLVEAFGAGLPVIASRLGALAELVREGETGLLFEPSDAAALAGRLCWAEAHPHEMARMGRRAREVYEAEYTPERNHALLSDIYRRAVEQQAADAASGR